MNNTNWLGIITPEELKALRAAGSGGRVHPVAALALAESDRQV